MGGKPEPEERLTDTLVSILEAVAGKMHADRGTWTIELRFQNGKLDRWFRHEGPGYRAGLAQFSDSS